MNYSTPAPLLLFTFTKYQFSFLQRDPDIIYEILFPSYFFLLTRFGIHWNCGLVYLKITNEKEKSLFLTFRGLGHENHSFGSNVRVQRAGESICAVYWTRKGKLFFFQNGNVFITRNCFKCPLWDEIYILGNLMKCVPCSPHLLTASEPGCS